METELTKRPGTTKHKVETHFGGGTAQRKPSKKHGSACVQIEFFTDPLCVPCQGMLMHLQKLEEKYGHHFGLELKMGGLMPMWELYRNNGIGTFEEMARHWQAAGLRCGVPTDGSVWLTDPPHSSFPPAIAFKAAQLQDAKKALKFFNRLGEMLFIENKNISRWKSLAQAAEQSGLDPVRLKVDHAREARHHFEEDILLTEKMEVMGFPTLYFKNDRGHKLELEGYQHFEVLEEKLLWLVAKNKVS